MTTPRVVTNALHKGDWAVSIDLKDAYFHVPIHVRSRRLLRFALTMDDELRIVQFRALPFGLTSAPRVFTKVILPVGQSAHRQAVCLVQYLDDWLLRSPDMLLLARQTSWLLDVIRRVGFTLNVPKSQLVPTQRLTHIGVEYQLDIGLMFPPMETVQQFEGRIRALLTVRVTTAYFWLSRCDSSTYVRQLHRCGLPDESRRDGICISVSSYKEDPPSSKGSADYHPGQTHSRGEECISRPTLQEGQSS